MLLFPSLRSPYLDDVHFMIILHLELYIVSVINKYLENLFWSTCIQELLIIYRLFYLLKADAVEQAIIYATVLTVIRIKTCH